MWYFSLLHNISKNNELDLKKFFSDDTVYITNLNVGGRKMQ